VLSSAREGFANVLLESMACGTPVVASPIPGNDEAVQTRAAGLIAAARTPSAIADAVRALHRNPPDRDATRAYAAGFGWDAVSRGQLDLFNRVLAAR
jgi:glycosyltransferase involved in cell wall biosynthesis